MYSTCLFCRARFAANEAIEIFPVGRRLAFDPVKGRLWVLCARCDRWNLTPVEERFEALEFCEARYRAARTHVSTDNIGLARISPTLDLVRVGRALRPEFAAWRYGPKLRRRRAEMTALVGASLAGAAGIGVGGVSLGAFGMGTVFVGTYGYSAAIAASYYWRTVARVDVGEGEFVDVRGQDLRDTRLRTRAGECLLDLKHARGQITLFGPTAIAAARAILPATNRAGGSANQVTTAVRLLETRAEQTQTWPAGIGETSINGLLPEQRLAIEMASNEEIERRAMEGELATLERAWRDAETIAAISDSLLVPAWIQCWMSKHSARA
jgi:hypothetical protein